MSRSDRVTIRTRLSGGSGVSSRFIPAGITNDIEAASETTGAALGIFCDVMTGAVIGFPGLVAARDRGKEQVKPGIVTGSIDRGKHQLRVVPELDPAGPFPALSEIAFSRMAAALPVRNFYYSFIITPGFSKCELVHSLPEHSQGPG
jgi:hypothetical protein